MIMKKLLLILLFATLSFNVAQAQLITTSQGVKTTHKHTVVKKPTNVNADVKGFEQMAEGAFSIGEGFCLGADYIAGYRFNNYFFLGGGTGLNFDLFEGELFFPKFYLHTRAFFTKTKVKPFTSLSLGLNCCALEEMSLYFSLMGGVSCYINKSLDWNISAGVCINSYPYFHISTGFTF